MKREFCTENWIGKNGEIKTDVERVIDNMERDRQIITLLAWLQYSDR